MANHTPEAIEAFGAVRESYSCGMSNTWKTKNSESRIKILRKLGYPHTDAQVLSGLEYNQFSSKLQKQIGESLSKITPIKQKVVAVESEEDKTYKNMYDSYLTTRSSQIKKPMNENLGNLEISNTEWDLDDDKLECKKCGYKINVINDEYAESEANNHIKNVHSKANEDWYEDEDKNVSSVMKYKLVYINGMDFGFQTNSKKEAEDTVDEWNTVFRGEPIKYITQESYYNGGYNADGYNRDGKKRGESKSNEDITFADPYYKDGYDEDGYDNHGRDKDGFDRDGRDQYGYNKYEYDRYGLDRDVTKKGESKSNEDSLVKIEDDGKKITQLDTWESDSFVCSKCGFKSVSKDEYDDHNQAHNSQESFDFEDLGNDEDILKKFRV